MLFSLCLLCLIILRRSHSYLYYYLSDVYSTIGYYLRHQDTVEAYLNRREQLAKTASQRLSSIQPDLSLIRSRLLAQRQIESS